MGLVERIRIAGLNCVSRCGVETERPVAAAIFLHGFGAPGTDLVPLAGELVACGGPALNRMRFIFPEAPLELDADFDGRCWWPINMERMMGALAAGKLAELADFTPEELPESRAMIRGVIDWCRSQDGISAERILLGGFSQGAMLAADVALSLGGEIGGLCLWSGMMINQHQWRRWAATAKKLRGVQSHGALDPVLPFACGDQLRGMLAENGHAVEFIRFQGYHQIPQAAIDAAGRLAASLCEANAG